MNRVRPIEKIIVKGSPTRYKRGAGPTGFPRLYRSLIMLHLKTHRLAQKSDDFETAIRAANLAMDLLRVIRTYAPAGHDGVRA